MTTSSSSLPPASTPFTPACQSPKGWTDDDVKVWAEDLILTDAARKITFESEDYLYLGGKLCQPVKVQVEFWQIDFQTLFGSTTFEMRSVLRKQVSLDGKKTVTVEAPKGFVADDCRGTVIVAYVGKPLSDDEIPESLRADGFTGRVESFWNSDRVFYTFKSMPKISDGQFSGERTTACEVEITAVPN